MGAAAVGRFPAFFLFSRSRNPKGSSVRFQAHTPENLRPHMGHLGSQEMSRDQFVWGLSNGVAVLAISGAFWLGLAAWGIGLTALIIALAPILVLGGALMVGSVRLRRAATGFSPRSLRGAPKGSLTRRIIIGFYAVSAAQWVSICSGRRDLYRS